MTQVTFLHDVYDRLQAVTAWLARAHSEGCPVLVYVPARERREQLDRLLWAHPATSFTPHCSAESQLATETPITLTSDLSDPLHDICLLNLSDELPPGFGRFQRLIEIISVEDEDKLPGRERYRFYRERGYPLEARNVSGGI